MEIRTAIKQVTSGQHLSADEMTEVMGDIMSGKTTHAQNAAFLVGLQMKTVQVEELFGAARVMRELVTSVDVVAHPHLVDTCGTGGSGSNKFNVSTAAALVAACAGAKVAKHGNRGATSKSGSADVLEAAGVVLTLTPEQISETIDQIGVGFMFAPSHHSAMKHVITARKEIGIRTMFNLLGPLTNPAAAPNQVMGVFDAQWIPSLLQVLKQMGSNHVLVVAANDGLDEISISASTEIGELREGQISNYQVTPEDFGMTLYDDYSMLQIDSVEQSLDMLRRSLDYSFVPGGDIVALNAGAAIYAANLTENLAEGIEKATEIIKSGAALDRLDQLAAFTTALSNKA